MKKKLCVLTIICLLVTLLSIQPVEAANTEQLNIGDHVLFGSYNNHPILWRVININEDGSRMLFSERVIARKGFDPRGNAPGGRFNQARLDQGSNYYPESTLRTWLNSIKEEVSYPYNPPVGHPDGFFSPNGYADLPGLGKIFSPADEQVRYLRMCG